MIISHNLSLTQIAAGDCFQANVHFSNSIYLNIIKIFLTIIDLTNDDHDYFP